MANQSPDRRDILELIALAAAASRFPGFARWRCAPQYAAAHDAQTPARSEQPYQPLFFTPAEFETLEVVSEIILPQDESPGAREAGVAEFIDFMAAHDPELQWPFRYGMDWLNARAFAVYGSAFTKLPKDRQMALLQKLASRENGATVDADGRSFFLLVRKYTVMGYYTSRVGLEALNYPGLKFYSASPACPHTDDPEHKHLPPPIV